jgi:hypothetical protein
MEPKKSQKTNQWIVTTTTTTKVTISAKEKTFESLDCTIIIVDSNDHEHLTSKNKIKLWGANLLVALTYVHHHHHKGHHEPSSSIVASL